MVQRQRRLLTPLRLLSATGRPTKARRQRRLQMLLGPAVATVAAMAAVAAGIAAAAAAAASTVSTTAVAATTALVAAATAACNGPRNGVKICTKTPETNTMSTKTSDHALRQHSHAVG